MKKEHTKKAGFTLIEVIVVIVIMAILAAAAIPTMLGFIDQAKENEAYTNISIIRLAFTKVHVQRVAVDDTAREVYIHVPWYGMFGGSAGGASKKADEVMFEKIESMLEPDKKFGYSIQISTPTGDINHGVVAIGYWHSLADQKSNKPADFVYQSMPGSEPTIIKQ